MDSETDLTTNGLISDFSVRKGLFSLSSKLRGPKSARKARLCFSFDDTKTF